jgi:hypothetical protein
MGRRKDRGSLSDRGPDKALQRSREQRRAFTEAHRLGQQVGEGGKGAGIPRESTADHVLHGVELGADIIGHAAEAVGAGGVAAGSVAAFGILKGHEIVKAIGEVHAAHSAESQFLGTSHALSHMIYDAQNPNNPHIRDGQPYDRAEFAKRVDATFGNERDRHMVYLQIENSDARKQYDTARDGAAIAANEVLKQAKSPQERQQAMEAFTSSAAQAMVQQRTQWNQAAGGPMQM